MYTPREQRVDDWRDTLAPAALSAAQVLSAPAPGRTWRQRLRDAEARLRDAEWVHDLAEDIGSPRWFRGLGTMIALAGAALLFWPNFEPVEAAPAAPITSAERDEFRSQMIAPLAYGADTGRRMGATAALVPLASAPERPTVQLTATLAEGDSFGRMLQRAGVGGDDAARIAEMVAAQVPLGEIAPGTRIDITLGHRTTPTRPRPVDSLAFRARFDLELEFARKGGGGPLELVSKPIAVDTTPLRIRGVVGQSLYLSARAAGAPARAIQQYLRTLDQHLSLDQDVVPSDEFDLVVAFKRSGSGEVQAGDLLYAGLVRDGRPQAQLLRWGSSGQFLEAGDVSQHRTGMAMPVAGRLTSGFGMRRHPLLGFTRLHAGIDLAAAYGTPIHATADGIVTYAGWHGGHGNFVRLVHGGGVGSGYGHMSRIAVAPGQQVRQGQVIGYVGSTGLSTGAHLHYEVYRGGRPVDPLSVQFVTSAPLDGAELAAFRARMAELLAVKPGAALAGFGPRGGVAPPREIGRLAEGAPR